MLVSSILKQNRQNKELQDKLQKNIQNTSVLIKAILPENGVPAAEQQINDAIKTFEDQSQAQTTEKKQAISFQYPQKSVQVAELEYHKLLQEEEAKFRKEYQTWNEKIFQAHQATPGHNDINDLEDINAVATQKNIRISEDKPYYIAPTKSVIKIGETHFELQLEKRMNPDTNRYEWERQGLEILERMENNDTNSEDNCIAFEGTDKKHIDWEITLKRIRARRKTWIWEKSFPKLPTENIGAA